jgi:hypothetical protein
VSGKRPSRLGELPARYAFVLNRYVREKFTRCPRCQGHTRLRKLPLLIHVERPDGPRLTILGKTCRLCPACEVLVAHEAEISTILVATGIVAEGATPEYVVLGTVDRRVWRAGMSHGVTLEAVRGATADFKQYMSVRVEPRQWVRAEDLDGEFVSNPVRRVRRREARTR